MSNSSSKGTKIPNVPNLRFADESWKVTTIGTISDVVGGGTPSTSNPEFWDGPIQWFTPTEIGKSKYVSISQRTITELGLAKSSAKQLPKGAILLTTRATIGDTSIALQNCTTNQGFQSLVAKENIDNEFLYYLIGTQKDEMQRRANGSTFIEISNSQVKSIQVSIPDNKTQKKVGLFLSLIDARIEVQNKIIEQLKSLKTSIIDRHFSKPSNRNVGQHIVWASERNKAVVVTDVYSMSNSRGFVPQTEQFEDRIISSDDVSSYKIVRNGCFVYNPARINVGSIALYSRPVPCIVSPMYNCFFVEGIEPGYLCAFFQSKQFKKELQNKLEGSVRRCLTPEGMNQIHFFLASEKERVLLIEAVYSIEKKICIECKMLSALQKQKGYLLSNMFL